VLFDEYHPREKAEIRRLLSIPGQDVLAQSPRLPVNTSRLRSRRQRAARMRPLYR